MNSANPKVVPVTRVPGDTKHLAVLPARKTWQGLAFELRKAEHELFAIHLEGPIPPIPSGLESAAVFVDDDCNATAVCAVLTPLLPSHVEVYVWYPPVGQTWEDIADLANTKCDVEIALNREIALREGRFALLGSVEPEDEGPQPLIRQVPAAKPFPVDSLGPPLAAMVLALNEAVQSPVAMCANSVLAAVTFAAQAHIDVELPFGEGSRRPVSSFFVTVGRSGERKSATDELVMRAVKVREAEMRVHFDQEMRLYRDAKDAWEAERKKILGGRGVPTSKKNDLAALGEEPNAPLLPIMTMEDPTIEGLGKLFIAGQPSVGVFSTEGGQFVGGHAMSDEAKLRAGSGLSRTWDGESWKRVRSTDGAHTIANKRLTVHLMMQPDVASQFVNDPVLRDQGLVSRMLVICPQTTMGTRLHRQSSPAALAIMSSFNKQMSVALARSLPLRDGTRNEVSPRLVRMSAEAQQAWIEFSDRIERMIGPGGKLEPISGFAAKMAEHAARVAAAIAWWRDHDVCEIGCSSLTGAIQLVEHYAEEALRLFQASAIPTEIAESQRLLDWLQTRWPHPHVSIRQICRFGPNSVRVARRAKELVKILEQHGWLTRLSETVVIDGRRCRKAWSIAGATQDGDLTEFELKPATPATPATN